MPTLEQISMQLKWHRTEIRLIRKEYVGLLFPDGHAQDPTEEVESRFSELEVKHAACKRNIAILEALRGPAVPRPGKKRRERVLFRKICNQKGRTEWPNF
jgi:hypothetical protein